MTEKCIFCVENEGKVFFSLIAIDPVPNGLEFSHSCHICYICLSEMFKLMTELIHQRKGIKRNAILPSIPWARRQRMGKITDEEKKQLNKWFNNIKNSNDFKEDK